MFSAETGGYWVDIGRKHVVRDWEKVMISLGSDYILLMVGKQSGHCIHKYEHSGPKKTSINDLTECKKKI